MTRTQRVRVGKLTFLTGVVWALAFAAVAAPAETVRRDVAPVVGDVQFWSRACDRAGHCTLPQALGPRQKVSGEVHRPTAPGQLGTWKAGFRGESGLKLELSVLWRALAGAPTPSKGWFATQADLSREEDSGSGVSRPIAQCSQYLDEDAPQAFPVGACGGFVTAEGGGDEPGYVEFGVTFYKAQ